jgi:deazaflavin-dependent oxidoreductase (nitroreductase family)
VARAYRRGPARRIVNGLVRLLLALGWGPPSTYLLAVRGRTSGRIHSTPVTLVEGDGGRWLVAPYGDVAWVRNARAAGEVTLRRGRSAETVKLVELSPEASAPVLKQYLTRVPITRPYFDVTPRSDLDAFAAEAPRHPVFRIEPRHR